MPSAAADLVAMGDDELESRLEETRRELFNLRFQLATGQLDNPTRIRIVRRDVARILTVLRGREISEDEAITAADALEEGPIYETPDTRRQRREAAKASAADDEDEVVDEAPADDEDVADEDVENDKDVENDEEES